MSKRSQLSTRQHSLHAFLIAAKERGHEEFQLQLILSPNGRIEFTISPKGRSEMSGMFEVRGNMVRAAARDPGIVSTQDDAEAAISYGGTRSGGNPLSV